MGDLPMSNVITSQPAIIDTGDVDDTGYGGGGATSTNRLTGFGPLEATNKVTIKQRIRACDIASLCTGCEVDKRYTIHGKDGEILYWAKETSNFCSRYWCGNVRSLSISIRDQTDKEVLSLTRDLNCSGMCCNCCYPHCTQEMVVSTQEEKISSIRERATWIYPVYHLFDGVGNQKFKVRGICCNFVCCADVPFRVLSADSDEEVALITKKFLGPFKEGLTDADHFTVDFKANLNIEEKSSIMAVPFLIDLMYYEYNG